MRDAFVAALTLNIFNKYPERIRMANIAQVVNVLQSMILTNDDKMLLTPTYHVFEMYKVHQDAISVPLNIISDKRMVGKWNVPYVTASASRKNGVMNLTLTNIDLNSDRKVKLNLSDIKAKTVSGRILTSAAISNYNTFEKPESIQPQKFSGAKISNGELEIVVPSKSIVVLEIQ